MNSAAEAAGSTSTAFPLPRDFGAIDATASHAAVSERTAWADSPIAERLCILRGARHRMAAAAERFAAAMSPTLPRSGADTLTAELMPLLDACKFLEKNAERVLRTRKLGRSGRPLWLQGVSAEVQRVPLGEVLVIGPANFPLFLPGVQALQALASGNSVVWKPAPGGRDVAVLVAEALQESGLPPGLLRVTEETVEAAQLALAAKPAKIVFTGSYATGCAVLGELAKSATPAVMELSGADAVVVMQEADLARAAKAIAFGLRLNGGQVCMSPRRLFAEPDTMTRLLPLLTRELSSVPAIALPQSTAALLGTLVEQAEAAGAQVLGEVHPEAQRPLLVRHARGEMLVARTDVFAPVLSLLEVSSLREVPEAMAHCSYGLTVAIFCSRQEERAARALSSTLQAGTILINDLIAPTADPRVPFGGRGASGYGVTRGEEGLLEMTAPKVLLTRRGGRMRHLEPTRDGDMALLANLIRMAHAGTWRERWMAMKQVATLGRQRGASAGTNEHQSNAGQGYKEKA